MRLQTVIVLAGALFFSFWLMIHTFSYDQPGQNILMGTKVWSDFAQHIPVIRSFSHGANLSRFFGPGAIDFPLFPGSGMRYHFLFYALVGLLEHAGLRIDWAMNIPSALGFAGLLIGIFLLARTLFKNALTPALTLLFFLFNGSLGFLQFFKTHPLSLNTPQDIVTLGEFPSFAPWGPGPVSAFWNLNIYTNQRHLAGAFAIVVGFILSLLHLETRSRKKQLLAAVLWGAVFGLFPFFHQPSLLIVAIILICYFVFFPRLRIMLCVIGLTTLVIALPQILPVLSGGPKTVSWYPGYLIHDQLSALSFLTYWWHNLGLHALLIPIGFFFIPVRSRKALSPLVVLFIIANLFKFSVEPAASHKFFNFTMLLGSMITAQTIVRVGAQKFHVLGKILLTGVLILLLTLSGIIDFFVIFNDKASPLKDIGANKAAQWIDMRTAKDAVFLNSSYLYHPASLAGRAIFLGWPYFPWSLGYPEGRMELLAELYESKNPALFCPQLTTLGIHYVTVEETHGDVDRPTIDTAYFFENFTPSYEEEGFGIFSTDALCSDIPSMEG